MERATVPRIEKLLQGNKLHLHQETPQLMLHAVNSKRYTGTNTKRSIDFRLIRVQFPRVDIENHGFSLSLMPAEKSFCDKKRVQAEVPSPPKGIRKGPKRLTDRGISQRQFPPLISIFTGSSPNCGHPYRSCHIGNTLLL